MRLARRSLPESKRRGEVWLPSELGPGCALSGPTSLKLTCGRDEILRRIALSLIRPLASSPIPLYTPVLWRQINGFMEVDFQAIKLEELKSRLGELRRYL